MLVEYAKFHGIDLKFENEAERGEAAARKTLALVEQQSGEIQGNFFMDLDDIDSMGKREICERISNHLQEINTPLDDDVVESLGHWKEWSLYFYLNHKDLFYKIFDSCTFDMKQGWKGRKTVSKPFAEVVNNIEDLKRELKKLYKREHKGNKIKIRHEDKGDRVIFPAHIQDAFTVDTGFKKDNEELKNHKPRKPVFPINFLYRPEKGVLEVKAKGGKPRVKELQGIFIEHYLKADPSQFEDIDRFGFDKIQDLSNLDFPIEAQDNVESVILNGLKVSHKENHTNLKIDIYPEEGSGVGPMLEALQARDIDLDEFQITQIKVKILFKPPSKGKQRSVTVTITDPDGCNLKQREIDLVVYELLKRWGLILF